MGGTATQIVIELLQGGAEPKGELSVGGGQQKPFAGWLGLIAALESAVHSRAFGGSSDGSDGRLPPGQTPGG